MVKKSIGFFKKNAMIDTKRSTRGMTIKVLNYNKYQSLYNYQSTDISTKKAPEKHQESTPINKNDKNDKKNTISKADALPINDLIKLFEKTNPSYERLYANKTQRGALERLVKKFGVEKVSSMISALPGIINQPYAPNITTPCQLEDNLGKLVAFVNREKNKKGGVAII
jgi:hypothetical protein